MTDFSYEVCKAVRKENVILIFENPEDLGAVQQGPFEGVRPASMWQWPIFWDLIESGDFLTCALYQQDFGTNYLKPTRPLAEECWRWMQTFSRWESHVLIVKVFTRAP